MSTLNIPTTQLVSTVITVPLKGSPSSRDYNDTNTQNLLDHAAMINTINDSILPVLNTLPSSAASGLLGATLYTDTSSQGPLTYNSSTNSYLTVSQTLTYLSGLINTVQTNLVNINTQVGIINSKLSATNQNDISIALQSFQTNIQAQETQIVALQEAVGVGALTFINEVPSGSIPGTSFTLTYTPLIFVAFCLGGLIQKLGTDYTRTGSNIITNFTVSTEDSIYALYFK
jgi:hypothetical protein